MLYIVLAIFKKFVIFYRSEGSEAEHERSEILQKILFVTRLY
jgi:hypothetical protein